MGTLKNSKILNLEEMVWKGVIIRESLEDDSLLDLARIGKMTKTRLEGEKRVMTFCNVEIQNSKVKQYTDLAVKFLRPSFYTHLCNGEKMQVIFRGKLFHFEEGDPNLEKARKYGLSQGILTEQMEFEYLIRHPYGRSLLSSIANRIFSYFRRF